MSLAKQQYLHLTVNKGDLNLMLSCYGPDGQKILEHTSRRYEAPDISLVAESAGQYWLEVHSLEQTETDRRFELRVGAVKTATSREVKDSMARSVLAEASRLRAQWEEAALRQAIEKYKAAWQVWRAAGDWGNAAGALMEAAEVHFSLGEYRPALTLYQTAAAVSKRAGDEQREAAALAQAGRLFSYLGDNDQAKNYVKRGLDYYARYGDAAQPAPVKRAHAEALNALGEVYYSKGDLAKTYQTFEAALPLFVEVGDRRGEGWARLFLGYLSNTIGEREKALTHFQQALTLYRAIGDRMGEGLSLTALGITHSLAREEEAAMSLHREAMLIFRTIGDRQSEASTLNGIGQAYQNLNEYALALENYKQALTLSQANDNLDLAPITVYQIASIYHATGDNKQALEYYDQCVRLSRAAKKRRVEAYALNEVAAIYAAQGERGKTLAQYQKVLRFYEAASDRRGRAFTLNNLGDFFFAHGDKHKALDFYKQALSPSQRAGERGIELATLYNIARAARDCGEVAVALARIEQSINIIDALRSNVASPDFRSSYFAGVHRHYELYIELLMQQERARPGQGFAAAALRVSENARARSLVETLAEARADIRQGAEPAVLQRERELQQLLRAQAQYQMELAGSSRTQAEAAEVEREIEQLRAEYEAVQGQLRQQNARYVTLIRPEPLKLEQIQAELRDGNTLLLEYALGEERSYLWAVTADSLSSYELPARETLETAAREVYDLLTARQPGAEQIDADYQGRVERADRSYQEKALALSRMLLVPLADRLGDKRLIIVTEGVLQYIPFDALPLPAADQASERAGNTADANAMALLPLVSRHEVVYQPSITTLAAIRREQPRARATGKIIAVLADPVFSSDDRRVRGESDPRAGSTGPAATADAEFGQRAIRSFAGLSGGASVARLAHSSEEADAIVASAPRNAVWAAKDFAASRQTAMSGQLGQYQIVHFATHGFINSEHPELSGILLTMVTPAGGPEDGFLQLHDIYNLNLSADLVVLSACDTALGKDVKGEGLVGLTRGFMYAGSKSVVASLWKVDDRATAELMGSFYKALLQDGLPPAAALRAAKETLRRQKRWRAPYYWAGFILQGEYCEPIRFDRYSRLPVGVALLLAPILLTSGLLIYTRWRRTSGLR